MFFAALREKNLTQSHKGAKGNQMENEFQESINKERGLRPFLIKLLNKKSKKTKKLLSLLVFYILTSYIFQSKK